MIKSIDTPENNNRLQSIDIVRGIIMIIMALDHVRDFFSYNAFRVDDVTQTSVPLFFTRWITHLCAPTFIFLSGISIYLYAKNAGSLKKTSVFLLSRGLWLILVEIFIISFILTQGYQLTLLEVIWATGVSMILMAALVWLPRWAQITLAIVMIAGHNALPMVTNTSDDLALALLHNFPFFISSPPTLVAYTIVPWLGVMLLGYCVGNWFTDLAAEREKRLLSVGLFLIALFILLKFLNIYGDPEPWSVQERGSIYTLLSFLKISKSPPSLLFLCITLGIACILLAKANKIPFAVKQKVMVYGRVPFFFFVLHLAVISLSSYVWTYFSFGKPVNLSFTSPMDWPAAYSPNLLRAYVVWIVIVIALYFPCRIYSRYKSKNKRWWMSYL